MIPENQTYTNFEDLRTSETINEFDSLNPEIIEELIQMLEEKGIDGIENPFEITREELEDLASKLEENPQIKEAILRRFAYKEVLEKKGYAGVNTELLTNGLEGASKEIAEKINEISEKLIGEYDFIPEELKGVLQLGILKNILEGGIPNLTQSALNQFKEGIENIDINNGFDALISSLESSSFRLSNILEGSLSKYKEIFDNINNDFSNISPELNENQKKNIIANNEWFRSPEKIANGNFDMDTLEMDKADENFDLSKISDDNNQAELLNSMMNARSSLENIGLDVNQSINLQKTIYSLLVNEKTKDMTSSGLEFLLKIPILGKLIAGMLGLNGENSFEELMENTNNYKMFLSFRGLGAKENENGGIDANTGKEPFKGVDLSEVNFDLLKDELKSVRGIVGNIGEDNYESFWLNAFNNGYNIEIDESEIKLKFEFTKNDDTTSNKLSSEKIRDIIKEGINKFNQEKSELDRNETETQDEENN